MSDDSAAPDALRDPYRELFERSADAILIIRGETFVFGHSPKANQIHFRSTEDTVFPAAASGAVSANHAEGGENIDDAENDDERQQRQVNGFHSVRIFG